MRLKFTVLFVLLVFVAAPVFAQSAGVAGISGVVRDPSGAVVPGAKVVISSEGQGTLRTLESNDDGVFTAPALVPGPGYRLPLRPPVSPAMRRKSCNCRSAKTST